MKVITIQKYLKSTPASRGLLEDQQGDSTLLSCTFDAGFVTPAGADDEHPASSSVSSNNSISSSTSALTRSPCLYSLRISYRALRVAFSNASRI